MLALFWTQDQNAFAKRSSSRLIRHIIVNHGRLATFGLAETPDSICDSAVCSITVAGREAYEYFQTSNFRSKNRFDGCFGGWWILPRGCFDSTLRTPSCVFFGVGPHKYFQWLTITSEDCSRQRFTESFWFLSYENSAAYPFTEAIHRWHYQFRYAFNAAFRRWFTFRSLACIVNTLKKFGVYILIVVLAVFLAGLYGVVHNQISYTVAPEYFSKFKFRQFGFVDTPLPDRVRASMIGFLASWWMGIPIGLMVGAAGFIHRDAGRMLCISLWSLLVAVGFTLLFGLGGLLYGYAQTAHIDIAEYRGWFIPEDVTDLRRFLCAGYMHNSSYLGGVIAIFVAWAFHFVMRRRMKNAG